MITAFLANELIDHALRNVAYTAPATVYVGLFTGSTPTELSGDGYARESAAFDVAADGATANSAQITFGAATADWGEITAAGLFDALSGGNELFRLSLVEAVLVMDNDSYVIDAGDLTLSFRSE